MGVKQVMSQFSYGKWEAVKVIEESRELGHSIKEYWIYAVDEKTGTMTGELVATCFTEDNAKLIAHSKEIYELLRQTDEYSDNESYLGEKIRKLLSQIDSGE